MIDYPNNYPNMVIVCYPSYAGAKFLINCLGLGPESVFQHQQLAQQQIDGQFDYSDKIRYLHNQLDITEQTQVWNDLGLGSPQLLGINTEDFVTQYHEILAYQITPVVNEIIRNNLNMFMITHSTVWLDAYLKFWPRARVIFFSNYKSFRNSRQQASTVPQQLQSDGGYRSRAGEWVFLPKILPILTDYWNTVRGPDWPTEPPTNFQEFEMLPEFVQHELRHQFKNYIVQFFNYQDLQDQLFDQDAARYQEILGANSYVWDVQQSYQTGAAGFLNEFEKCRQWLGVSATNNQDLVAYFERWLRVISNNSTHQSN